MTRDHDREAAGLRHRLRATRTRLLLLAAELDARAPGLGTALATATTEQDAALIAALWNDGPAGSAVGPATTEGPT